MPWIECVIWSEPHQLIRAPSWGPMCTPEPGILHLMQAPSYGSTCPHSWELHQFTGFPVTGAPHASPWPEIWSWYELPAPGVLRDALQLGAHISCRLPTVGTPGALLGCQLQTPRHRDAWSVSEAGNPGQLMGLMATRVHGAPPWLGVLTAEGAPNHRSLPLAGAGEPRIMAPPAPVIRHDGIWLTIPQSPPVMWVTWQEVWLCGLHVRYQRTFTCMSRRAPQHRSLQIL